MFSLTDFQDNPRNFETMMKTALLLLLLFFLLRFMIRVVWPIVKVARSATKTFRNMQEQMYNQQQQSQASRQEPLNASYKSRPSAQGDYIEFEEIKK